VVDEAAALFLERGFHGTSVDDVGAAAGISGPGLYRHFASKDALLMAVLDRLWEQLRPAINDAADRDPADAVDVLLAAHLELAIGQPAALVLLVRELRHLPDDYRALAMRNHRRYLDAWATAIAGVHPQLDRAMARTVALAVHGLVDSAALRGQAIPDGISRTRQRALLEHLAHATLQAAADHAAESARQAAADHAAHPAAATVGGPLDG
jgi:AcrR family transcriptional regulator